MARSCSYFKLSNEDYQTTTATYHRFIPSFPQEFNFRIKPQIQPNLLVKDVAVNDETFKTENKIQYGFKLKYLDRLSRPPQAGHINYIRPIQEKYLKLKLTPPNLKISETKASFGINNYGSVPNNFQLSTGIPSYLTNRSTIEEEFSIPTEQRGYWKYLDPYLTNNKCDYKFNNDHNLLKDKIITFYNAKEHLHCISGNQMALRNRTFSRAPKNLRLTSETRDKYKPISPYPNDFCIRLDKYANDIC